MLPEETFRNETIKFQNKILKVFFKNPVNEERTYFALTMLTALLSAGTAVGLSKVTHALIDYFGTNKPFELKSFLFGGLALFISGYISTRLFPSTSGSGIPGVRVALAVFHGRMPLKDTLAKFVTSALSLSSGMSLGREGPTAAISAGIPPSRSSMKTAT